MSWIGRVVRAALALVAAIASVAGIVFYVVTGRHQWVWLAIGGLLALSVSLGWWLWAAKRSLRRIASRGEVIDHLALLARVGKARLRLARLADDDAATLSERYVVWDQEVRKVIEEHFGNDDLALFEVSAPMPTDLAGITARWHDSLDRLVDLILHRG